MDLSPRQKPGDLKRNLISQQRTGEGKPKKSFLFGDLLHYSVSLPVHR